MAEEVRLKIRWPINPGQVVFANNTTLQQDASGTVYLTFFQVSPPVVIGSSEEVSETLAALEAVDAIPIARIAMSPMDAIKVLDLLKRNLEPGDDSSSNEATS